MDEPEESASGPGNDVDPNHAVFAESRRRTRRSFGMGALAAAAGYCLYKWIDASPLVGRLQSPLRKTLEFNRGFSRAVFREQGLAPEYDLSHATELRLNGTVGLQKKLDLTSWRLQLAGSRTSSSHPRYTNDLTTYEYLYEGEIPADQQVVDVKTAPGNGSQSKIGAKAAQQVDRKDDSTQRFPSLDQRFDEMNRQLNHRRARGNAEAGASASGLMDGTPGLLLTIDDLSRLPKVELVTQFKCIEGWSQVVHWGGYRLRDLMDAYPPALIDGKEPQFVYMETPDGDYYGGYDMAAARHPQSLLVTEMEGQMLTQYHGAPLRLHMPVKYGYKQLKRIGVIAYMSARPDDYWTKLGYDWYAGL
jgi:hypothetical protein